jgi:SNF2-related domain
VTARAARRIRAKHKIVLTGTPVQNRVSELWAVCLRFADIVLPLLASPDCPLLYVYVPDFRFSYA